MKISFMSINHAGIFDAIFVPKFFSLGFITWSLRLPLSLSTSLKAWHWDGCVLLCPLY